MFNVSNLKNNSYDYLFSLLIITIPFSNSIPNIIMGLLCFIFIFKYDKQDFSNYHKSSYFFLTILIVYTFLKAIYNNSFIEDMVFYKKYFYLIIIPILMFKTKNLQLLKFVSIITINLTILISVYKIIKFYYYFNFIPFADGWATNSVLILERPYAGIFSIICIVLSFDQILLKTKGKYMFILSLLLSTFFIFFISIRISILTLFVLFLLYGLFYYKVSWKRKIVFSSATILMFSVIFLLNKNIIKRFFIDESVKKTIEITKQFEPRVVIWGCAKEITNQDDFSVLFGTHSYSNIKNSLVNCYSESVTDYSRRNWFLEHSFNTHSQFIDLFLIGGLFGISLFVIFLAKNIYINNKDFCSVAIVVSFIMIFAIENIFHRQFGCFIFTIFTALYLNKKQIISEKAKN